MKESEIDSFCPSNQKEWRKWLEINHEKKNSVWLIFHKKGSLTPNLSWSDAVDEALCFGWIDSVKKSIDTTKYKQYFGKRKPKSTWSRINKEKVKQLIDSGFMTKAGLRSIETAKLNGSWTILDSVEKLEIPVDLEAEFEKQPGSRSYFLGLNKSIKKGILYWIVAAKKTETRNQRILETVENAAQKQKPKQFR